jgi:hypothetical protein
MKRLHILDYDISDNNYVVDVVIQMFDDPEFDYVGVIDDFPAEEIQLIDGRKGPFDMIGEYIEATDHHISVIVDIW